MLEENMTYVAYTGFSLYNVHDAGIHILMIHSGRSAESPRLSYYSKQSQEKMFNETVQIISRLPL